MREATFEDAVTVGQQLNLNKDEVWKIIKGIRYSSRIELSLAVHRAFKVKGIVIDDAEKTGHPYEIDHDALFV
jgi:hypothetical protein